MCCPIGITWGCDCEYRGWLTCLKSSNDQPCGMEDLRYGLPPPPSLPNDPVEGPIQQYQELCRRHQNHLKLVYCCSPHCCQIKLMRSLIDGRDAASDLSAIDFHLSKCWPHFRAKIGKLNSMRFPGEPLKQTEHISDTAVIDVILARGEGVINETVLTAFARLYKVSEELQSCDEAPNYQYIRIRNHALANVDADIHPAWKPTSELIATFVNDQKIWETSPETQNQYTKERWSGYAGLDKEELDQVVIIRDVTQARAAAESAAASDPLQDQPEAAKQSSLVGVGLHDNTSEPSPQNRRETSASPLSSWLLHQPVNLQAQDASQVYVPLEYYNQLHSGNPVVLPQQDTTPQGQPSPLPAGPPGILIPWHTPPRLLSTGNQTVQQKEESAGLHGHNDPSQGSSVQRQGDNPSRPHQGASSSSKPAGSVKRPGSSTNAEKKGGKKPARK